MHLDRCRCDRAKMQPRRRDRVEIGRIRKKREHFIARSRQPKLALDLMNAHESWHDQYHIGSRFQLTMDSINQNQPEMNRADLHGAGAIKQAKELIDKAQTCFFCTAASSSGEPGARPMSVQECG